MLNKVSENSTFLGGSRLQGLEASASLILHSSLGFESNSRLLTLVAWDCGRWPSLQSWEDTSCFWTFSLASNSSPLLTEPRSYPTQHYTTSFMIIQCHRIDSLIRLPRKVKRKVVLIPMSHFLGSHFQIVTETKGRNR
jgi:hypothetical protein